MLAQVTLGGELFEAQVAVERRAIVETQVSAQTIESVEFFQTTQQSTLIGFFFRVHSAMNLKRVRGEKSLVTCLLLAAERKFT